jgi:hypothetical protein
MDSRVPKNEREWWASREIEKLERKLADWSVLKGWGGTPEIVHKFVKGQQHRIHYCQNLEAELTALAAERDRLRAEVERWKKQIKDDNRSYGCELRDPNGTIWQQATKDRARAERAEAELITERARLDYLGLHMGTALVAHALNCDYSRCFPIRDAIDLAMKNETNP